MESEKRGVKPGKRKAKCSPKHKPSAIESSKKLIQKAKRIRNAKLQQKLDCSSDEFEEEERTRTPSGMELGGKVQGIRTFFSPVSKVSQNSQDSVDLNSSESGSKAINRERNMFGDKNNNMSGASVNVSAEQHQHQQSGDDELLQFITRQMKSAKNMDQRSVEPSHQDEKENSHLKGGPGQLQNASEANAKMVSSKEQNDSDNPSLISVAAVVEMFKSLKMDFKEENNKLRKDISKDMFQIKMECKTEAVSEIQKEMDPKLKQMEAEIAFWKIKAETLAEVCDRINYDVMDVSSRLDTIEMNGSKRKAMLTGVKLHDTKDKERCIAAIDEFLSTALGISVHIDDFFMIGESDVKPIVLIFSTLEQKRNVMRLKSCLKGIKVDGNSVFLSDYLPPTALEKRKRDYQIADILRAEGKDVSYQHGSITVEGQPYKKRIVPPTPKDLINVEPEEISRILSIPTTRGEEYIQQNSNFLGYAVNVTTYSEVNDVYRKIKLIKPDARHVVCSFILNDSDKIYGKDYHDDGEPGAGRLILELMEQNGIQQKAVFVARRYGGIRMGTKRFSCYLKAARSCLGLPQEDEDAVKEIKNRRSKQFKPKYQQKSSAWAGRGARGGGTSRGRGRGAHNYVQQPKINFTRNPSNSNPIPPQQHQNPTHAYTPNNFPPLMRSPTNQWSSFLNQFPAIQTQLKVADHQPSSHYEQEMQHKSLHQRHHSKGNKSFDQSMVPATSSARSSPRGSNASSRRNSFDASSAMEYSFAHPINTAEARDQNIEKQASWSTDNQGYWSVNNSADVQ